MQQQDAVASVTQALDGDFLAQPQFGAQAGQYLRGEQLRALLAALVLAVAVRFGMQLLIRPDDLFSMAVLARGGAL